MGEGRRRAWQLLSAGLLAACALPQQGWGQSAAARHVNEARLRQTLEKLSEFGRNPEGGVSRVGFTEADLAGRQYVIGLMREAGLEVRVDPAGNIFGHRAGSENLPVLLFGSHTDSVPHGGNFDGDVGSMSAIEVVRALNEGKLTTRHPIEVVIWTNEEGGRVYSGLFGSSAAAGRVPGGAVHPPHRKGGKLDRGLPPNGGGAPAPAPTPPEPRPTARNPPP